MISDYHSNQSSDWSATTLAKEFPSETCLKIYSVSYFSHPYLRVGMGTDVTGSPLYMCPLSFNKTPPALESTHQRGYQKFDDSTAFLNGGRRAPEVQRQRVQSWGTYLEAPRGTQHFEVYPLFIQAPLVVQAPRGWTKSLLMLHLSQSWVVMNVLQQWDP